MQELLAILGMKSWLRALLELRVEEIFSFHNFNLIEKAVTFLTSLVKHSLTKGSAFENLVLYGGSDQEGFVHVVCFLI